MTEVEVFCADGHAHWTVARFEGAQDAKDGTPVKGIWSTITDRPGVRYQGESRVRTFLSDDKILDPETWNLSDDLRIRHDLRCYKCANKNRGATRIVVRSENLYPILDILSENGISKISLTALGARLGSNTGKL